MTIMNCSTNQTNNPATLPSAQEKFRRRLRMPSVSKLMLLVFFLELLAIQAIMWYSYFIKPHYQVIEQLTELPYSKSLQQNYTITDLKALQQKQLFSNFKATVFKNAARIQDYCSLHRNYIMKTLPNYTNSVSTLSAWIWMISDRHKLFYCAIPKCGSTTLKSYLMEDLGIDWQLDTHEAARQMLGARNTFKLLHVTPDKYLNETRPKNRLVIVRNPWERIASAYEDKLIRKNWPLKKMCAGWKMYENVTKPSFKQFVDCLLQRPTNQHYESHTHPMSELCALCLMDYNIVLKLEDMKEFMIPLMDTLGFSLVPKYKSARTVTHQNIYNHYYKQLDKKQITALRQVYQTDLKVFGYPDNPLHN